MPAEPQGGFRFFIAHLFTLGASLLNLQSQNKKKQSEP